jgi:hypothetical protein
MQTILQMLVFIVQLAVASFVMWGGWLCFSAWLRQLRGDRASRPDVAPATAAKADSFERVASLVLLALLCTTIAALG